MKLAEASSKMETYRKLIKRAADDDSSIDQLILSPEGIKNYLSVTDKDLDELWTEATHYYKHKEFEKAIETLAFLMVFEPSKPLYIIFSGTILVQMNKIPEALSFFQAASEISPQDPSLDLYIGQCCNVLGQKEEARAAFQKCIENAKISRDPNSKMLQQQANDELNLL